MDESTKNQGKKLKSEIDKDSRKRKKEYLYQTYQILSEILPDDEIRPDEMSKKGTRWDEKKKKAEKALPVVQQWAEAQGMVKQQASSSVPNQERYDEIYGSLVDITEVPEDPEEALKKASEELKNNEEEIEQTKDELEQKQQYLQEMEEKNKALKGRIEELKRQVEGLDSWPYIAENSFLTEVQGTYANGLEDFDIAEQPMSPSTPEWDMLSELLHSGERCNLIANEANMSPDLDETCIFHGYK